MSNSKRVVVIALMLGLSMPAYAEAAPNRYDLDAALGMIALSDAIRQQYAGRDALTKLMASGKPTAGGSAEYVCPFRANGEIAEWVRDGQAASVRRAVGPRARSMAPQTGIVSRMGGWDRIRTDSDYSFDRIDDLAVFMHANYATHADYPEALAAVMALYPELRNRYAPAVGQALEKAYADNRQAQPEVVALAKQSARQEAMNQSPHPSSNRREPSAAQLAGVARFGSDMSDLTTPVEQRGQGLQMLTQTVDLGSQPQPRLMASSAAVDDRSVPEESTTPVAMAEPQQATPEPREPEPDSAIQQEIERIMRPVKLAEARGVAENSSLTAAVNLKQPELTVEQRLAQLKARRVRGEISGETYLAERRRIIYG